MPKGSTHKYILVLFALIGFSACVERGDVYLQFKGIENAGWNKNTGYDFAVDITDTVTAYTVFLEIRNNASYSFRNLWLFVDLKTPEGNTRKDTVNFELANALGQWYGRGSNLHSLSIPYEQDVRFRIPGAYVYSIKQGMREDDLKGISDIGLRVVKQSNH